MTRKKILPLLGCILLPVLIGGFSGFITKNEVGAGGWFESLIKPSFNPPNYLFGPVWTALYLLMGISLIMIWNSKSHTERKNALVIFAVQLFLNFWWSILFFRFHLLQGALVDIFALWVCIVLMILVFKKINPLSAYLQLPYLLWVTFATVLNASILFLNT